MTATIDFWHPTPVGEQRRRAGEVALIAVQQRLADAATIIRHPARSGHPELLYSGL